MWGEGWAVIRETLVLSGGHVEARNNFCHRQGLWPAAESRMLGWDCSQACGHLLVTDYSLSKRATLFCSIPMGQLWPRV